MRDPCTGKLVVRESARVRAASLTLVPSARHKDLVGLVQALSEIPENKKVTNFIIYIYEEIISKEN